MNLVDALILTQIVYNSTLVMDFALHAEMEDYQDKVNAVLLAKHSLIISASMHLIINYQVNLHKVQNV